MRTTLLAAALFVLAAPSMARATVPQSFSVQGVLRDSSGKLQTMSVTVQTNFFDAQTAGNLLNPTPYLANNVMAVNGLFTVTFSDAMVSANLAKTTTGQLWIEVTVGNDTYPRQQVTPGIWALMCASADHATEADDAAALQSVPVSATAPTNGQVLRFGGGKWAPSVDAQGGTSYLSFGNGITLPAAANTVAAKKVGSVQAPGPGVIQVVTTGRVFLTHTSGTDNTLSFKLSSGAALATVSEPDINVWGVVSSEPSAGYSQVITVVNTFPVAAAGNVDIYINLMFNGGAVSGDFNYIKSNFLYTASQLTVN